MPKEKCRKRQAPDWSEEEIGRKEKIISIREQDDSSTMSATSELELTTNDASMAGNRQPTFNDLVTLMYALTENVHQMNKPQGKEPKQANPERKYVGNDVLPEYNPEDKTQTVVQWITKVEQLKEVYHWDETTTVYNATTKLRGLASSWFRGLPAINFSWEEWKAKLIRAFPEKNNFCQQLQIMLERKKKNHETMMEYYYEKLVLLNHCRITGEDAISCIIEGLGDKHTVTTANAKEYKEPEDLLVFLKRVEDNSIATPNKENYRVQPVKRSREDITNSSRRQYDNYYARKRRCYECGSRDHLLPQCPRRRNQKKCEKCHRFHPGECRRETPRDLHAITAEGNSGNKYFMQAIVKEQVVRVFVDLGSSCNIMKDEVARNLGLEIINNTKILRGYGGGLLKTLGTTEEVAVVIDQARAKIGFDVVPNETQEIPAIIGQPFTEQPHIIVYKNQSILRIFENTWNSLPSLVDLPPLKIPVWAKNSVVIPPKEAANIICYTAEYNGELCVESSIRVEENNEHCIPRCIVSVKDNEVVILVINPTSREVIIKTKNLLARGQPCFEGKNVVYIESADDLNLQDVNISKEITEIQHEEVKALLKKYKHCFASTIKDFGNTKIAEMKITLRDDKPVVYKPYRMPQSERDKVTEIVGELLQSGIIRESNSPYSSPVLLVKKKNGEQRLCIDYRKLNSKIVQDRYPLPRIEDQLSTLHGYSYYTSLDMTSGYYQIPIEESSKDKTAFVTYDGQYEFNRMPFGLSTAPAVFQRMVNKVLGPLKGTIAMAYLDDILIPSTSFEEGIERLEMVLKTIEGNTLTLNPRKCKFFQTSISYLGYEINKDGMRPGKEKTKCIEDFPTPQNIHQIRQFMGLTGFFRQFIKDYALISRPLTELTRKNKLWSWDTEQQEAFMTLKRLLAGRPILAIYNAEADTEVHTDASKLGVAGILLQKNENGKLHPIAYYSRQTTPAEEKYHSYELETLAVVETLKKFRIYLLDLQFKIITDCSSIKAASQKKDLVPRIARWWLLIQEFNFTVEHRPGAKMQHVDALSRNPIPNDSPINEDEIQPILRIETADWVLASQLTDEKLKLIYETLQRKPESDYEKGIHKEYSLDNGRIYRNGRNGKLWVIPKGMRQRILKAAHDDCGHFSLEKTLNKICETYWFPEMRKYVEKYISCCIRCAYHKRPTGKLQGFLHPIEKQTVPFHTIHMDHLGPFKTSPKGNKYLIVAVESATKYAMLKAVKSTKTAPVINFLNSIVEIFGVPNRLVTDKGTCYTSHLFKRFCEDAGIKHIQTAVATPRANGQVERFNSTILASLARTCETDTRWDKEVPNIQFALNNTVHSVTKRTPSELLFAYRPRAKSDSKLSIEVQEHRPVITDLQATRREVKERVDNNQDHQKRMFDKKRRPARNYCEGELVLVQRQAVADGQSKKLLPTFKGPFRIKKKLPNDRYIIEELPGSHRGRRTKFESVESVEHLKPWIHNGGVSASEEDDGSANELGGEDAEQMCQGRGNYGRGRPKGQDGRAVSRHQGKHFSKS